MHIYSKVFIDKKKGVLYDPTRFHDHVVPNPFSPNTVNVTMEVCRFFPSKKSHITTYPVYHISLVPYEIHSHVIFSLSMVNKYW